MTACAMTVGMVPMALALEKGSQMQAPLGRAVIGGLVMSTFATLLVLPSIFALVIGRKQAVSPSIYPDDPESKHYDPLVFVNEPKDSHHHAPEDHDRHDGDALTAIAHEDVLIFLRRILDEARKKRHDMITHYTVDDLRVALGFEQPRTDAGTGPGATAHASGLHHLSGPGPGAPPKSPPAHHGS
jgi:hypothetical protein